MPANLTKQTAQQIVEAVKDVCGYDINYINTKGIIFASTNSERIGNFHEIGKKVIDTGEAIEVFGDDDFFGTQMGVNIPFRYNREMIAVIGISGNPEEVRKYATLAQKITSLIIRERETDSVNYNKRSLTNYVIRTLTEGGDLPFDYLKNLFMDMNLDIKGDYRSILVRLNARYNSANISMIESQIYRSFDQAQATLYTFNFPGEYVLILPEDLYQKHQTVFEKLAADYPDILSVGIGSSNTVWRQSESFKDAKTALASLRKNSNYASFENLDLELILSCVSENIRRSYMERTIDSLDAEDREILQVYFENEMTLKQTADQLFLHQNTLQYKLNRIHKKTSLNPRRFSDAVKLYLALKL